MRRVAKRRRAREKRSAAFLPEDRPSAAPSASGRPSAGMMASAAAEHERGACMLAAEEKEDEDEEGSKTRGRAQRSVLTRAAAALREQNRPTRCYSEK